MTKKITIISQDYDGCYSIMTEEGAIADKKRAKETWDYLKMSSGVGFTERLTRVRRQYHAYLSTITEDASEVRVYVGSHRQSKALDDLGHRRNQNGSVFPALERLCCEKTTPAKPWQFEPLLMSDPIGEAPYSRQRGQAYQRIISQHKTQLNNTEPHVYFICEGGSRECSKRPLLLTQMWDAYHENSDATELEFHFIDDNEDMIVDVLDNIKPDMLPPNMTLKVTKFNYFALMQENNTSNTLLPFGQIVPAYRVVT